VEADVATSGVDFEVLMTFYVEDNTSQSKCWIFDSGSMVHVYSHKEMFNSLVANEEETVKMVNGSTCEIIGTKIINVTYRDGTVHALKAVWYVSEVWYNLIFIGVLDKEGCLIQMQQGIAKISYRDMVILKGEKCGGVYKLKEENSV